MYEQMRQCQMVQFYGDKPAADSAVMRSTEAEGGERALRKLLKIADQKSMDKFKMIKINDKLR